MLLEIGSVRILTDPVFDEGERYYSFGFPFIGATRRKGPAFKSEDLPELDAILLSHTHHSDNLDECGRALFPKARRLITNSYPKGLPSGQTTSLDWWQSTDIHGEEGEMITVTATPALHGPPSRPESSHVCGFILDWRDQEKGTLYISGDTVYFDGLLEIPRHFEKKAGTALLHLGAVHFWPPYPRWLFPLCTFDSSGAVKIAKLLGLETLIPIHYEEDVWSHFKEDLASYERAFSDAGLQDKVTWLQKGVRTPIIV